MQRCSRSKNFANAREENVPIRVAVHRSRSKRAQSEGASFVFFNILHFLFFRAEGTAGIGTTAVAVERYYKDTGRCSLRKALPAYFVAS